MTRPSELLAEQCQNMLARTPAAYVWLYHERQVAVVSANSVLHCATKAGQAPESTVLGTKNLPDFFLNLADCFIGDPDITAWDDESLRRLRQRLGAETAFLLEVDVRETEAAG